MPVFVCPPSSQRASLVLWTAPEPSSASVVGCRLPGRPSAIRPISSGMSAYHPMWPSARVPCWSTLIGLGHNEVIGFVGREAWDGRGAGGGNVEGTGVDHLPEQLDRTVVIQKVQIEGIVAWR